MILLLLQYSSNGRKIQKKSRKNVTTKIAVKDRQLFSTKIKQDIQMPVLNAAKSKIKEVNLNSMPLPNPGNKMEKTEWKKIKNKSGETRNLSGSRNKYQSFDDERRMCNSEVSDVHPISKQKRKQPLSFDNGSLHCKNKRKKINTICSQDDPLLPVSNISKKPTNSENKELTKRNGKKQSKKKQKKAINSRGEYVSENVEKLGSSGKSPYSIHKLKQILSASSTKKEVNKESISEKKQIKETESLREKMLKRLQASRFR
jgi:hypothetical protein